MVVIVQEVLGCWFMLYLVRGGRNGSWGLEEISANQIPVVNKVRVGSRTVGAWVECSSCVRDGSCRSRSYSSNIVFRKLK